MYQLEDRHERKNEEGPWLDQENTPSPMDGLHSLAALTALYNNKPRSMLNRGFLRGLHETFFFLRQKPPTVSKVFSNVKMTFSTIHRIGSKVP